MLLKLILLISIEYFTIVKCQQDIGDSCTVSRTGSSGTCKLINNCQSVIDDIRKQRYPTVCGYQGRRQIVCCPNPTSTQAPRTTTETTINTRISIRKCNEYRNAIYEKQSVSSVFSREPIIKNVSTCGFTSVPLIVGGTKAGPREFPHMALIGYDDGNTISWECGGSLISEQYVLTAGHCVESRDLGPAKYVKLGDLVLNTDTDEADPIEIRIAERIKNPGYKASSNYNDIALLRLQRRITFNRFIRPACLYDSSEISTKRALATGWGRVEWGGHSSDPLLKVTLELFTYQECNTTFKYDINRRLRMGIVDDEQFCAGSHTDNKDTCQGDSGGPLQIYHPDHTCMYSIIGVTSFGKACGLASNPGVYTRVSNYLPWIESTVWPNE